MAAPELQLGLDKVRVNKTVLIDRLHQNLESHQKEYTDAHAQWKKACIAKMEENLTEAKETGELNLYVSLSEPENHSEDYRRIISLLSASIDETLVISAREFRQYHDDEWGWTEQHKMSLDTYSTGRGVGRAR